MTPFKRRKRRRPGASIDLLLKAALAPDADAKRAWALWRQTHAFTATTYTEMQVLVHLAARMPILEPEITVDAPHRWSVEGFMDEDAAEAPRKRCRV